MGSFRTRLFCAFFWVLGFSGASATHRPLPYDVAFFLSSNDFARQLQEIPQPRWMDLFKTHSQVLTQFLKEIPGEQNDLRNAVRSQFEILQTLGTNISDRVLVRALEKTQGWAPIENELLIAHFWLKFPFWVRELSAIQRATQQDPTQEIPLTARQEVSFGIVSRLASKVELLPTLRQTDYEMVSKIPSRWLTILANGSFLAIQTQRLVADILVVQQLAQRHLALPNWIDIRSELSGKGNPAQIWNTLGRLETIDASEGTQRFIKKTRAEIVTLLSDKKIEKEIERESRTPLRQRLGRFSNYGAFVANLKSYFGF